MDPAWYRSWPEAVPAGRAYVYDSLPRLVMRDCNYATLADYQPWPADMPGWFMVEWDVALDRAGRDRFAEHALATPDRILVAPYRKHYPKRSGIEVVHRVQNRPLPDGQPWTQKFGFGCIYFPQPVLDRWWAEMPGKRFSDTSFSMWHWRTYGNAVVDWSVHPQHLHGD